jgi:hypothetical protein
MRIIQEWFDAGVIGEIEKVYCWTDRPVWPKGIPWPKQGPPIPKNSNGTSGWARRETNYIDNLVHLTGGLVGFGTGALGIWAAIIWTSFKLLGWISYRSTCNATTVYSGIFKADFPESIPPSVSFVLISN